MRFELDGIEEMISRMEQMGKTADLAADKMLNAAAPILRENLKRNIKTAAVRGYATGELAGSIAAFRARQNKYGHFTVIAPVGKDKKGVRNAEKLAYLEYGVDGRQRPNPVMQKTVNESRTACLEKMQEVFNAEVGG